MVTMKNQTDVEMSVGWAGCGGLEGGVGGS